MVQIQSCNLWLAFLLLIGVLFCVFFFPSHMLVSMAHVSGVSLGLSADLDRVTARGWLADG